MRGGFSEKFRGEPRENRKLKSHEGEATLFFRRDEQSNVTGF